MEYQRRNHKLPEKELKLYLAWVEDGKPSFLKWEYDEKTERGRFLTDDERLERMRQEMKSLKERYKARPKCRDPKLLKIQLDRAKDAVAREHTGRRK